jgi:outer membrane lipopolysaccharide assembly protein LptE/RlpB
MARIEDIKWSVAKFLVVSAVIGILTAIGFNLKGGGQ